ncbi:hypothetical protein [Colwellia sp. RSH04]|uniref:hypothetical protein n=1 Tax=Colwellia sp. RSH04 TaxID=2305464 RepID=UPI000E58C2FA|nr:hypothetical protein [Colwellia sp. RSH04]RHW75687.1 hypothetical protein D1094_11170 [Colwellia sp. RSH04]
MISKLKHLSSTVLLMVALTISCPIYASDTLPYILNYYPASDYEVLKSYSAKKKTYEPSSKKTNSELINKLRIKAASVGADAVILVSKRVKKVLNPTQSYNKRSSTPFSEYSVIYEADLIRYDKKAFKLSSTATPYNEEGLKQIKTISNTTRIETKFVFMPPTVHKLHRPEVTTNEVSIKEGVYGIALSTPYKEVNNILGDPSVELKISDEELILGYGRNHWFHFKNNELVMIQTDSAPLSFTLLNEIPLLDFYDDKNWSINGLLERNDSLEKVQQALGSDVKLNKNNQVIINQNNTDLTLHFDYSRDDETNKKHYFLTGFTLKSINYKYSGLSVSANRKTQFETISELYSRLQTSNVIDTKALESLMGEPIGRIFKSANSFLTLYNSNLYVHTKHESIKAISFIEEAFVLQEKLQPTVHPWFLGPYIQNGILDEMRKSFPNDAFDLDNEVSIDTESYKMSLYFEEIKGENRLYEAQLVIY